MFTLGNLSSIFPGSWKSFGLWQWRPYTSSVATWFRSLHSNSWGSWRCCHLSHTCWGIRWSTKETIIMSLKLSPNQMGTCDHSVTYRYQEFFSFFGGIGGIGKIWYHKKYRNQYRKKLVPEKSIGTGIRKSWYRKKVSEPVSENLVRELIFLAKI